MDTTQKLFLALSLTLIAPPVLADAIRPQENYIFEGRMGPTRQQLQALSSGSCSMLRSFKRLADGRFVLVYDCASFVLDAQLQSPVAVGGLLSFGAIGADGFHYYVGHAAECGAVRCLTRRQLTGEVVAVLALEGAGPNDFPDSSGVFIADEQYLVVRSATALTVYDLNGTKVTTIDRSPLSAGTVVGTNGKVFNNSFGQNNSFQRYDLQTGAIEGTFMLADYLGAEIAVNGDRLFVSASALHDPAVPQPAIGNRVIFNVLDLDFRQVGWVDLPFTEGLNDPRLTFDGDIAYVASTNSDSSARLVGRYRRAYRTHGPLVPGTIPSPILKHVGPGTQTGELAVTFRITDPDSATVSAYALGFIDDASSLADARVPVTFTAGASSLGASIATGTDHQFTWNAAADIGPVGDFADVQVALLARDQRALLDIGYLRLPPGIPMAGDPELVISRSPVTDRDMLNLWYWLLASRDPAIALQFGGTIVGVGGPYAGQTLATDASTTAEGRAFLFERLAVREATADELTRVRTWTTPGVQSFAPLSRVGRRPVAVNEIGFEVGAQPGSADDGFWVVPNM